MFWKQVSSAKLPFGRHPKMHKTLALRSYYTLPRAAPRPGNQIIGDIAIYADLNGENEILTHWNWEYLICRHTQQNWVLIEISDDWSSRCLTCSKWGFTEIRIRRILESKSSAIESRMAESCYGMQTFSNRRVAMVAMTIYSSIP